MPKNRVFRPKYFEVENNACFFYIHCPLYSMVCALNLNHRNGLASAQVAPTDDIILPRIPHAHDAHAPLLAPLLAPVIVPRAQQRVVSV